MQSGRPPALNTASNEQVPAAAMEAERASSLLIAAARAAASLAAREGWSWTRRRARSASSLSVCHRLFDYAAASRWADWRRLN